MKTINLEIGKRGYSVHIGHDLLKNLGEILKGIASWQSIFILTDMNVEKLYSDRVVNSLKGRFNKINHMAIPPEEEGKSIEVYEKIIQRLIALQYDRKSLLIALGGGVVGDIGGFVACTYMRGIDLIHIPTTLLAQVDSSIGGKTAINYYGFKNLIGSFYHPRGVIIDLDTLQTLDQRLYQSAFGEIIKYGLIGDASLLLDIYENVEGYLKRKENIAPIIEKCIRMKGRIVGQDEEDHDQRMVLNLGHTFGHAIESATEFKAFVHGEAVGIGIWMAAKLAYKLEEIDPSYYALIESILKKYSFAATARKVHFDPEQLLALMGLDKKNSSGRIRFILPTGKGQVDQFTHVSQATIIQAIMEVNDEARNM